MCNLTRNIPLDCQDSVGGIKELKLRKLPTTSDVTLTSANVVSAITTSGWYKYEFNPETASFTENQTTSDTNGSVFYAQSVTLMLHKLSSALRNEIRLLAIMRVQIVIQDRNNRYWLIGLNNGLRSSGSAQTGQAMGDMNGYNLTFAGNQELSAVEVTSAIYATLVN